MQIDRIRKEWIDLFWLMANGDAIKYAGIKKINVFEFWQFFENWSSKVINTNN